MRKKAKTDRPMRQQTQKKATRNGSLFLFPKEKLESSELSTSLEFSSLLSSDLDLSLGSRIDAFVCRSLLNSESTETDKLYAVTSLEFFFNGSEGSVESSSCSYLREFSLSCDCSYEFSLVHDVKIMKLINFEKSTQGKGPKGLLN